MRIFTFKCIALVLSVSLIITGFPYSSYGKNYLSPPGILESVDSVDLQGGSKDQPDIDKSLANSSTMSFAGAIRFIVKLFTQQEMREEFVPIVNPYHGEFNELFTEEERDVLDHLFNELAKNKTYPFNFLLDVQNRLIPGLAGFQTVKRYALWFSKKKSLLSSIVGWAGIAGIGASGSLLIFGRFSYDIWIITFGIAVLVVTLASLKLAYYLCSYLFASQFYDDSYIRLPILKKGQVIEEYLFSVKRIIDDKYRHYDEKQQHESIFHPLFTRQQRIILGEIFEKIGLEGTYTFLELEQVKRKLILDFPPDKELKTSPDFMYRYEYETEPLIKRYITHTEKIKLDFVNVIERINFQEKIARIIFPVVFVLSLYIPIFWNIKTFFSFLILLFGIYILHTLYVRNLDISNIRAMELLITGQTDYNVELYNFGGNKFQFHAERVIREELKTGSSFYNAVKEEDKHKFQLFKTVNYILVMNTAFCMTWWIAIIFKLYPIANYMFVLQNLGILFLIYITIKGMRSNTRIKRLIKERKLKLETLRSPYNVQESL